MKTCFYIAACGCVVLLTGCFTGTTSTVTEYDTATGKIAKITETGESVVKSITQATKNKTCIAWESGWAAYISASTATTEDPTPTVKMGVGKVDKGAISLHPEHKDIQTVLPAIIQATRDNLTVSTDGVQSQK